MAKKIYEYSWWYDHLRYITDAYIKASYRRLVFKGMDKIPDDAEVIYAPNHCCALMDPLAVLVMRHEPVVFVARADIFGSPFIAKVLNFLRIMPINRIRDGFRSVAKSAETIDKSIEVLNNGVKFCILSEGTHRPMHSLMPIGKGITKVALGAVESGAAKRVVIVPVGLEYGDYFRYRTTLQVRVCDPVDVTALAASMPDATEREVSDEIRRRVGDELKENIVYIPDDEGYEAVWELSCISTGKVPPLKIEERFLQNRAAVEKIGKFREERPSEAAALMERASRFRERRKKAGISLLSLAGRKTALKVVAYTLLSLLCLPVFAVMAAASLPVWLPSEIVAGKMEDKAFKNSFRCGIMVFGWTLMLLIWAVVLFCTLKWYWALAALAVILPAPFVVYDCFELARLTASHWRLLFRKDLGREYREIEKEINNI